MVALNLGLQAPVTILTDPVNDVGIWGCIGTNALEKLGGNDVGGGLAVNGWLSIKLVEVDVITGAAQGTLGKPRAGEVSHVMGLEVDVVDLDEEVRDSSHILFKAIRALLFDAVIAAVLLELSKAGSHGFKEHWQRRGPLAEQRGHACCCAPCTEGGARCCGLC